MGFSAFDGLAPDRTVLAAPGEAARNNGAALALALPASRRGVLARRRGVAAPAALPPLPKDLSDPDRLAQLA